MEQSYSGHTTIIVAKGPEGDLYLNTLHGWVSSKDQATIFPSVMDAQRQPILGRPQGYSLVLIQAYVQVSEPPPSSNPRVEFDPCS